MDVLTIIAIVIGVSVVAFVVVFPLLKAASRRDDNQYLPPEYSPEFDPDEEWLRQRKISEGNPRHE